MPTKITRSRFHKTISLAIPIVVFALATFAPTDANALVTILNPTSSQDITSEAGNLFVYGDLVDYPIEVLELRDSNGTIIPILSFDSDYDILQSWYASFPPLAPGLYSLYVQDTNGNSDLVINLYVGP